jgi:hypothetical protein
MRIVMPTPESQMPAAWPPAVREYVEEEQENAYRDLADDLDLKGGATAAFKRLNYDLPELDEIAPSRYQDSIVPAFMSQEVCQQFNDLAAEHYKRVADLQLPTAYETRAGYSILNLTMNALRGVWASSPRAEPYLASLPSGDPSARIAIEWKTNAPVIFFEHALMQFIHDFGVVVAWATPPVGIEVLYDDNALINLPCSYQMPEIASVSFLNLLEAYVVSGTPTATAAPIPKPTSNMFLASAIVSQMEWFIMAHELAHLSLGHLGIPRLQEHEFAADEGGLVTMTEVARRNGAGWALSLWACDLALTCLDVLDRAISFMEFGTRKVRWKCATHPDCFTRRQRLRDAIGVLATGASPSALAAAGMLHGMSEAVIKRLWDIALPELWRAHDAGARPSPLWKKRIRDCFEPS